MGISKIEEAPKRQSKVGAIEQPSPEYADPFYGYDNYDDGEQADEAPASLIDRKSVV